MMSRINSEIAQAALTPAAIDGEGWLTRTFRFPEGFVGFSGHFPGYPLVPAVVQVLTAQQLAETRLTAGLRLVGVENAKFLLQIRPGQELTVRCRFKERDEDLLAEARLSCDQELAASFTLKFTPERPES